MSAALITALGAVGGAALNAYSQHKTNAMNREQANYAFQQQQQAIQRMNEFNSPAQQVVRMKAAGLNPALAYGADGAMVGNQSEVPAYNAIPAEAPSVGNIGAGIADAVRTGIEVQDLKRRQDLATAEMALKDAQTFLAVTSGELNDATKTEILSLLGYKVANLESQTELNWESVLKTRQEISNLKASKNEILSRIGLNEEQLKLLAAQTGFTEMQAYRLAQLLPHEISNMDADTALMEMNTNLSQEQILSIDRDIMHVNFVERLENQKFDFEKDAWRVEQQKWQAEYNAGRVEHFIDTCVKIFQFGVGAAALRNGQSLPHVVRPAVGTGHHGNTVVNTPSKPKTNAAGYRLGSR